MVDSRFYRADWELILKEELSLRGFSTKTFKSYSYYVKKFLDSSKLPREFLLGLINSGFSDETVRLAGFSVKFYLRTLKQSNREFEDLLSDLPNVKRPKTLPTVLSKKEIEAMIFATHNLKHRLMILVGYSAGLRVSEIVLLKWENVDFSRNVINIKSAKGKKDRMVMLSPKVKKLLKAFTKYQEGFVFKNYQGTKLSTRAVEEVVSLASRKAGIKKKVTPHTLRHSFATHLLENGVDIRYIQELLGHASVNTTLIYTKVSNDKISKIKSPIDF